MSRPPHASAYPPAMSQPAQLQQQNAEIIQNLAQINQSLVQINLKLQNMQDLLPMRLYNATASVDAALLYPPGVAVVFPIPNTKNVLMQLTVAQCTVVARALGLAHLPPSATVIDRRRQISEYLGCALIFYESTYYEDD